MAHIHNRGKAASSPEIDRQDKQDKEDIFNKIISPNLIEELANVKDAAAPVTLEIFSPVMVS